VKPPITPSSEVGVSPVPKEEDGLGKDSEDEVDAEYPYSASLFSDDHEGEECVQCQKCPKWVHTVCANYPKRVFVHVCDTCQKWQTIVYCGR
jgi:hypothetical protein